MEPRFIRAEKFFNWLPLAPGRELQVTLNLSEFARAAEIRRQNGRRGVFAGMVFYTVR